MPSPRQCRTSGETATPRRAARRRGSRRGVQATGAGRRRALEGPIGKRGAAEHRVKPVATLLPLLRPRSVAVIGASRTPNSIGREVLRNLLADHFTGTVYPVNPRAAVVHSMKSYRSVTAIPDPVDLAVIVVPAEHVLGCLEDCAKKGVKAAVIITAGFREMGVAGAARERELAAVADKHEIRLVGPNCFGVINTDSEIQLNATFTATSPIPGNVAFASQSGALGEAILADSRAIGLGLSTFVSLGNRVDVSANDLLEFWDEDPKTDVILLYIESFGNPMRFTQVARRVAKRKPIIVVKAGRTAEGARAATSHTGSIVGTDIAADSLFEQCGVLRVGTIEDMFALASAFSTQPLPEGPRVGVVTNAGGPGILVTDACVHLGLKIDPLSEETVKALRRVLPAEASVGNPVDLIASADRERYQPALKAVLADPGVDAVIAVFVSPIMIDAVAVARGMVEARRTSEKPFLTCFMGRQRQAEAVALLREAGIPVYRFPEYPARALAAMVRYRAFQEQPRGRLRRFGVAGERAQRIVARAQSEGRVHLTFAECCEILEIYGIPVAQARIAKSRAEAIEAALEIGFPVVLKATASGLSHKTERRAVVTDIRTADGIDEVFRGIWQRLEPEFPDLRVIVQKMVRGGKELIVGMKRDSQFGPLILLGMGGVYVEHLGDTSVRVHPITDIDAADMLRTLKAYPILEGRRGEEPVHFARIEEVLLRFSQLVADLEGLQEVDINPFIAGPKRSGCQAVDVRMSIAANPV
ncbi:MAG: acetate--CoA ligase family protein [Planctomycetota bacterium]